MAARMTHFRKARPYFGKFCPHYIEDAFLFLLEPSLIPIEWLLDHCYHDNDNRGSHA